MAAHLSQPRPDARTRRPGLIGSSSKRAGRAVSERHDLDAAADDLSAKHEDGWRFAVRACDPVENTEAAFAATGLPTGEETPE